jgi:hypothetical protein
MRVFIPLVMVLVGFTEQSATVDPATRKVIINSLQNDRSLWSLDPLVKLQLPRYSLSAEFKIVMDELRLYSQVPTWLHEALFEEINAFAGNPLSFDFVSYFSVRSKLPVETTRKIIEIWELFCIVPQSIWGDACKPSADGSVWSLTDSQFSLFLHYMNTHM